MFVVHQDDDEGDLGYEDKNLKLQEVEASHTLEEKNRTSSNMSFPLLSLFFFLSLHIISTNNSKIRRSVH